MLITLPAHVLNGSAPTSVLDLEPLMELLRQCGPDAVCLMPPDGPDDLPNGPALMAMKNCLASHGVAVAPGSWQVRSQDAVETDSWRTQTLFEIRALVAALGEAAVSPLVLDWNAPPDRPALERFLEPLIEEAERAGVSIALRLQGDHETASALVRDLDSSQLGLCVELWTEDSSRTAVVRRLENLGDRLLAVRAGRCWEAGGTPEATAAAPWRKIMEVLRKAQFSGPLLLDSTRTPVEGGTAVGFFRGLRAARGGAAEPSLRTSTLIEVV